jgi:hypothetical protein
MKIDYIEILCRERLEMSIRYNKEIRKWRLKAKKWKIRAQAKTRSFEEQESEAIPQEEAQELRRVHKKDIENEDSDETESEDEAPENSEKTRMSSQSL